MIKSQKISFEVKLRILSEIFIKISSFFIIPVITYNLGIDDYGIYIIVISIVSGMMPIFLLGLNFTVVKKLAVEKKIKNNVIKLSSSFFLITILFLGSLAFIFPLIYLMFREFFYLALVALIFTYCSSLQIIILEFLRSKLQSNTFSIFQIIDSLMIIILVYLCVTFLNFNLFLLFKVLIFNKIFITIIILIYLKKLKLVDYSDINLDKNLFVGYLKPGIIFIILGLTEWLVNFSDKLIIGTTSSSLTLGIYFTVGIFASSINSLGSIYWWDLYPRLSKLNSEGKTSAIFELIQSKTQLFIKNSFFLIITLVVLSPTLQSLILNKNIEIELYIYFLYFIAIFFHQISSGWEFFCYIQNDGNKVFITSAIWGIISLILYLVLIPLFSINGALISLLLSKLGYTLTLKYFAKASGFDESIFLRNKFITFIPFSLIIVVLLFLDYNILLAPGLNLYSVLFLTISFTIIYWPSKFDSK